MVPFLQVSGFFVFVFALLRRLFCLMDTRRLQRSDAVALTNGKLLPPTRLYRGEL
jgi:hypothetical protein